MPATETTILVEFGFDKETPGTRRFAEITEEEKPKMGTIWLRKDVAESLGSPERIRVFVTAI